MMIRLKNITGEGNISAGTISYFWLLYLFLKFQVQNCCLMLLYLMLRDISLTESSSVCASLYCSRLLLPPDVML